MADGVPYRATAAVRLEVGRGDSASDRLLPGLLRFMAAEGVKPLRSVRGVPFGRLALCLRGGDAERVLAWLRAQGCEEVPNGGA